MAEVRGVRVAVGGPPRPVAQAHPHFQHPEEAVPSGSPLFGDRRWRGHELRCRDALATSRVEPSRPRQATLVVAPDAASRPKTRVPRATDCPSPSSGRCSRWRRRPPLEALGSGAVTAFAAAGSSYPCRATSSSTSGYGGSASGERAVLSIASSTLRSWRPRGRLWRRRARTLRSSAIS
jgi:hypothetical protein